MHLRTLSSYDEWAIEDSLTLGANKNVTLADETEQLCMLTSPLLQSVANHVLGRNCIFVQLPGGAASARGVLGGFWSAETPLHNTFVV